MFAKFLYRASIIAKNINVKIDVYMLCKKVAVPIVSTVNVGMVSNVGIRDMHPIVAIASHVPILKFLLK